jgi:hypothetical protein
MPPYLQLGVRDDDIDEMLKVEGITHMMTEPSETHMA